MYTKLRPTSISSVLQGDLLNSLAQCKNQVFPSFIIVTYVLQGRFDEALEELEEALVIQKDILGPDNKITKNTVSKRSDVMGKRGSNPR